MPKLTAGEKAQMIVDANDSLNDLCTIHYAVIGQANEYGEELPTYTDQANIECGFSYTPEMTNERGQIVTLDADAVLRLKLTQAIDTKDQVTVRGKRWNVDGVIDGRTVRVVALKRFA